MEKVDNYSLHIYPSMDESQTQSVTVNGVEYRLTDVSHLKEKLKTESDARKALYKKYQRAVNVLDGVDTGETAIGTVLGGVESGLLVALIAPPATLSWVLLQGAESRWNKSCYPPVQRKS